MKVFTTLFGMAAAGLLGYMLEPNLRVQLTGVGPGAASASKGKVMLQMPDGGGLIDLPTFPADQLPEKIVINAPVKVTDSSTGATMTVDAGNRVKLIRVEGNDLIISPGEGQYVGRIAAMDTDLLQNLTIKAPETTPQPPPAPVTPPDATPAPEPAPVPPPDATPAPEPVPAPVTETPAPEDMPEPPPVPEPTPTPADTPPPEQPEPAPAPKPDLPDAAPLPSLAGGGDVVKLMQESVKGGQIKEFTFDQVSAWKAGDDEAVDGVTYKTGTATYKAETLFGVRDQQAKALIKDGKVQRWIRPRSGLEIK